jgi:hypothetical protein
MQPRCVEQFASVSAEQGVGVPKHVPVPFIQLQPFAGRQVVMLVLEAQGVDVPVHIPMPSVQ